MNAREQAIQAYFVQQGTTAFPATERAAVEWGWEAAIAWVIQQQIKPLIEAAIDPVEHRVTEVEHAVRSHQHAPPMTLGVIG